MPMQMNGVEAWITGEDKVHLDEFAPEFDQESGVVTCWISGEPGQVCRIFPDSMRGTDILVPLPDAGAKHPARRSLGFASVCFRPLAI